MSTTRRFLLLKAGTVLNGLAAMLLGIPIVGFVVSSMTKGAKARSWISLGSLTNFPEGQTRLATFRNPATHPWDGHTADIPCWVRRLEGDKFQVFAINCTHLGCPVRWFPGSKLFMCPCHGGVFYEDGSHASGPPPRGLYQYPHKVQNGELIILGGWLPTLADPPDRSTAC